jgi:hypothetical protein
LSSDPQNLTKAANQGDISRQIAVYRAIFEPAELKEMAEISDILQAVASIQNKLGSDTQTKQEFAKRLSLESEKLTGTPEIVFNIFGILGRTAKNMKDVFVNNTAQQYKQERIDAYQDLLIDQILNPQADSKIVDKMKEAFPIYYSVITGMLREGYQELTEPSVGTKEQQLRENQRSQVERLLRDIEEAQQDKKTKELETLPPRIRQNLPSLEKTDIFEEPRQTLSLPSFDLLPTTPSPSGIDASLSPTVLPSDQDRELAMRLRPQAQGIAALV